ncbi:MAG: hypothetical protein M0R80_07875 [Proteobacteria bacterium]|jgi:hypothetical protein|nr:hypothetical protein [Pseudomonadota bacterium]
MITITMSAKELDDGEQVHKPNGTKKYILRKSVNVFCEMVNVETKTVLAEAGVVFLLSMGDITCIKDDTRLSVDFDGDTAVQDALEFLCGRKNESL